MKLKEAIEKADMTTPNAFSVESKTEWINEVEGMVQSQVLLFAPEEIITYTYPADADRKLLVAEPHSKIYPSYLRAMMDFTAGDYDRYRVTYEMFNTQFREYMAWFSRNYRPADTHELEQPIPNKVVKQYIDELVGDIEAVLDNIIAGQESTLEMQKKLIGGDGA